MSQTENKSGPKSKKSLLSSLNLIVNPNQKQYNFCIQKEEKILKITMNLYSTIKLINAVSEALKEIGNENQLDNNPNNYAIYISKKNGLPKTDFPSYQMDLLLEETGNTNFSLVHTTSQNKKPYDQKIHLNQVKEQKLNVHKLEKKHKNWFLNFLGCS
ncbi:unnamed protein product [Paramecium pentaurelia]|uniref:Uncharacterized protein n=1 Tax=Paramecium pentaurelia TaxID=43138 RepID=A0A8S1T040_9CILI|nr:unnamed protein product [Paramecium pentaurelia]